jgi:hypothetical protein
MFGVFVSLCLFNPVTPEILSKYFKIRNYGLLRCSAVHFGSFFITVGLLPVLLHGVTFRKTVDIHGLEL